MGVEMPRRVSFYSMLVRRVSNTTQLAQLELSLQRFDNKNGTRCFFVEPVAPFVVYQSVAILLSISPLPNYSLQMVKTVFGN